MIYSKINHKKKRSPLPYLKCGEAHSNQEVSRPITAASQSHGCWAGPLGEQLGHNEPWDWTGAQLKHSHKKHDSQDGHVAHTRDFILHRQREWATTAGSQRLAYLTVSESMQWWIICFSVELSIFICSLIIYYFVFKFFPTFPHLYTNHWLKMARDKNTEKSNNIK